MKKIKITIIKQNVLDAIDALSFKRVDGVLSGQTDQAKNALSSDSEEALDKALLNRYMEGRDGELRARLAFCINSEDDGELEVTNAPSTEASFVYSLNAPDHFNKEVLKALAEKINNFFIDATAYDWYSRQGVEYSVGPAELDRMLTDIAVSLRKPFVKRPLQPFGPAV